MLVIINPVCGNRSAPSFFADHVLPLVRAHNPAVHTTTDRDHAGNLVLHAGDDTIVLLSGDGTLHDIVNTAQTALRIVLVPCGTANALYSSLFPPSANDDNDVNYRLQSLRAFLDGTAIAIPLSLANSFFSSPPQTVISAVVVSTSLHALILHDSDSLRATHPGIERFKVAAQRNSTRWYNASLKLFSISVDDNVKLYDPTTQSFGDHPKSNNSSEPVVIDGPFIYFLSTVNVDRLEPAFRIAPLARSMPPDEPSFDVVIIRPLRDPLLDEDTLEARSAYASKLWKVLGAVYQDGRHVRLRYRDEDDRDFEGDGPLVVEYIRCGGWIWTPAKEDHNAHFVCCDGSIIEIGINGQVMSTIDKLRGRVEVFGRAD